MTESDMKPVSTLIVFLLCSMTLFGMGRKPEWVEKRPVDKAYYIGIGMSRKTGSAAEYQERAREAALRDLASQIEITIQSENLRVIQESNQNISEQYTEYMKTRLTAELEGYELVDSWEDRNEYWVYYRLSKAKYLALKRAKIERAMSLALDYLQRADQYLSEKQFTEAIQFYFKALETVEKFADEPMETEYQGKDIYLLNELVARLQETVARIKLIPVKPEITVRQGQVPAEPLTIRAQYQSPDGKTFPVANLPVTAMIEQADVDANVTSSSAGMIALKVLKIHDYKKANQLQITVNTDRLFAPAIESPILKGIIATLVLPKATIYIRYQAAAVYISGEERNLGNLVQVQHIVPVVKQALAEQGFQFVDNKSEADYIITITANTVEGAQVYGMYTAFADVEVAITDVATNRELYREGLYHIKGIQLNFEKAGLKALDQAGKDVVEKIVPTIMSSLH